MAKTTWKQGIPLDSTTQEQLRSFVKERGEKQAAAIIGVGVAAVIRAAAGLGLRRGTARMIEITLADVKQAHAA